MPDIPNRDELERILARKLGGLNRRQLGKLMELMGDPPKIENVPMSFWDDAGKELAQVVTPFSERVYLEAAERMLETVPVGVDWSLVNTAASSWAQQYAYDLIGGINATSRQAVGQAVSNFFTQGWTMRDLHNRLGRIYSPVRAEMIAVTEVTRAAAEGERGVVAEIEKEGIRMVEVWQTNNDELVCNICGPRHGKKHGDGWTRSQGPPAHPRCRCWTNHEFEKPKEETFTIYENIINEEKEIVGLGYEQGIIFDEQGNKIYEKTDFMQHQITWTNSEIARMKNTIMSHNHPGGGSFSVDDIVFMEHAKLKEIRATGKFGTYSMKNNFEFTREALQKSLDDALLVDEVFDYKGDVDFDQMWKVVSKNLNLDYKFSPVAEL
jgi:hypothetical protein